MTASFDRWRAEARDWTGEAVRLIEADVNRSAETRLLRCPLPAEGGVELHLKDESTHPTGPLKHRLFRCAIYDDAWVAERALELSEPLRVLDEFHATGRWIMVDVPTTAAR